ncbi:hypothetical protein DXG03_003480 [Asterophora parasitica]|uniref:Uncharacterized protein n=1 Tax=Asterophora parasitica TaxID=117018 RepID=A0A9P7GBU4_9AGAR|nr:hypothetical protein DXG03_003480 [Asterophora parasitica]
MQSLRWLLGRFLGRATNSDDSGSDPPTAEEDWVDPQFPNSTTGLVGGPPVVDLDVFAVRNYLSYFVPIEVADIILNFALYWPCSVSIKMPKKNQIFCTPASVSENNAAAYYMVTPAIPPGYAPIQAVRFTIRSGDQGWGGDNFRGTYQGSYTWFEAAIIRDDREQVPQFLFQLEQQPVHAFNDDAFSRELAREIRNPLEESERWKLQYNLQVSFPPKVHQVVWMKDDVINDEIEAVARAKGAGTGRGFVSTLRPGDRVALVVRSQYPGWSNIVYGAKIEIFQAV